MKKINTDKYGIIGQKQQDGSIEGGDSANWMGHFIYLTGDKFSFKYIFQVAYGAYVRHPDEQQTNNGFGAHYENPWNGCISRDQLTGIAAALIKQKQYMAMLALIIHSLAWLGLFSYNTIHNGQDPSKYKFSLLKFFYNPKKEPYYKMPDVTLFNMWGMYLRGFGWLSWLVWPILCVFDIHLLIDTLVANKSESNDKINHLMRLMVAQENIPTITSKIAWLLLDKKRILGKIKEYWCGWRDNCGMHTLYENKVKELG